VTPPVKLASELGDAGLIVVGVAPPVEVVELAGEPENLEVLVSVL